MKNLLLVLGLTLAVLFSAQTTKAQTPSGVSVPIVTYKIDTTSYSHGLIVPAPSYFHVTSLTAEIDTSVGFYLQAYSVNTIDSTGINKIFNDSISPRAIYPMSIPAIDTLTLDGMVEEYIKKRLETVYGANNISKK